MKPDRIIGPADFSSPAYPPFQSPSSPATDGSATPGVTASIGYREIGGVYVQWPDPDDGEALTRGDILTITLIVVANLFLFGSLIAIAATPDHFARLLAVFS